LLLLAYTPGGVFKWAHEYWVRGSPVVTAEGMLVLDAGGLWELNPDSTQAWFVDLVGWDRENATPAIAADGTIYLGNGYDSVLALNPDGTQKWAFAADHELNKDSQQSTAAVGDDGTIYLRFYHEFYAINPDGTEKWHFDVGTNACSAPAVGADGTVFFASGNITLPETNKLYAFNADGSEKWEYYADGYAFAGSPTLDANGTVYVGVSGPCDIYAFYPDGTVKWVYDTLAKCGPVSIGADGTLYFGDNAGHLYALGPGEG
jgi:outer membrane protein assembly factor BamB